MHGWTDPMDPNGAPRRAGRPTDEPAWLHDRPEPRSAYLFGDEPGQSDAEWHREQADEQWHREQSAADRQPERAAHADAPTASWASHDPDSTTDRWAGNPPAPGASDGWRPDPGTQRTDDWHSDAAAGTSGTWRDAAATGRTGEGRHRSPRRWRRPLMIGGAAAAATLVVSVGVGALAMPGGDDGAPQSTAVDDTYATPAAPTEEPALDTLAAPSPSATPSPTSASPTPSKVVKPTPAASRTTAASRRGVERSSAPSTNGGSSGSTGSSGAVSAQAREVVDLVNAERAKAGCKALTINEKLMTAAQRHSQDQADHQKMSHTGSDGSNAGTRLDRVGYTWRTYGENVAWNQKSPTAVMDAWMNSSGHRANILNCAFTEIGVGIASSNGPYWTQVFAAPR
ncbi:CAP domain-containing protein [Micromonospora sp. WMMD1120]|uniref:CAP domain-containing protein n=1 Tax=Micromonospora sp. WMMD1120 TaxID=3016106 RepID=UPI002417F12C|nr:CAP domain-containing protein [Micromonospora sp. WMMD1120]MDG4808321.1 CAP domain-containing protein [Micromonospora sp. WMMD1120]